MGFTDAFEVRVEAEYYAQQMVQVWHVEQVGAQTAEAIANAFVTSVLNVMLPAQSARILYRRIDVASFSDPLNFFSDDLAGIVGTRGHLATDDFPTFVTVTFRANRVRTDVRHGFKRIALYGEDVSINGGFIAAAQFAFLEGTLAPAMLGSWGPGVAEWFIVKRVKVGTIYRLPINAGEYVAYRPITIAVNPRFSTQSSRKVGVGA